MNLPPRLLLRRGLVPLQARWALLSIGLLVAAGALASCTTMDMACDAKTCPLGCCDATGTCQTSNTNAACGSSAMTCQVCTGATTCVLGVCSLASGGGTGTGGGSGGGGTAGGTGGSGGTGGGTSSTQLCTDFTAAVVARDVRCGLMTPAYAALFQSSETRDCRNSDHARAEVDDAALQACLRLLAGSSCLLELDSFSPVFSDACGETLFRGQVPRGGECKSTVDCQDDSFCDLAATTCGRCVARAVIGQTPTPGQACVKSAYQYLPGGPCVSRVALNQPCTALSGATWPQECLAPNVCAPSGVCAPGALMKGLNEACTGGCGLGLQCVGTVCLPLGTEHQVCSPNFDGPQCQRGLTCLANVCVVDLPGDVGATCQETKVCQSNLFCSIPSGMTSGTCVERRAVNGPCVYGDQCQSDLFCTGHSNQTGVCIAGLASDPCQYGYAQCRHDLYCTATANTPSGQCAHKKGEGESCQRPDECLNSCVNAVCTRPYCTL